MKRDKNFRNRRNYIHKQYLEQGIRGGFHEDGDFDLKKGYSRKAKHKNEFQEELFDLLEEQVEITETKDEEPSE